MGYPPPKKQRRSCSHLLEFEVQNIVRRSMSKAAKDGNNFRREWDKEAFEKKAKERLEAELALEDEREERRSAPMAVVERAPLQRRTEALHLDKYVNTRQVITGAQAIAGSMSGTYHCKVCDCVLRDSANYLLHINGRKHNRMLGMTMRAERSTVEEVRARLDSYKKPEEQGLSVEEKAEAFLQQFDERVRAQEAAEREEQRQKRREQKEKKAAQAKPPEPFVGVKTEHEAAAQVAAAEPDDEMAACGFSFGSFGGSRKNV
uniref:U1-type domain-containing protein n=1 Tax=Chrysotila carterae TaxID=13221 RepID=A0A7S4BMD9_CHRCT